jgi:hypothetical protein
MKLKLKKHFYVNAENEQVAAIITTDNPNRINQAGAKLKIKFPNTYSLLKYAGSDDYTDIHNA